MVTGYKLQIFDYISYIVEQKTYLACSTPVVTLNASDE